jgi:hypothetical protein
MAEVGGGGIVPEPPAGGAGFKGIVGFPVSGGGFGGVTLLSGFVIAGPPGFGGGGTVPESGFVTTPDGAGGIGGATGAGADIAGADGGGTGGFGAAEAAGGGMMEEIGIFDVSFFGTIPTGAGADVPGTLMRTVSRLIDGCSAFGGRVIRMVSFFVESSSCVFDGSAMRVVRGGRLCISALALSVNGLFREIPVRISRNRVQSHAARSFFI